MKFDRSEQLFEDFQRTSNLLRRYIYTMNQEVGPELLRGQGRILRLLAEEDGRSQKELSQTMHIRPASLSELLKKLIEKEFVRATTNEKDRRVTNYWLTDAGKEMAEELVRQRRFSGSQAFSILDEEEQMILEEILSKVIQNLDERIE